MPQGQRARLWGAAACRAAAPAPALSTCAKPKAAAPGLALCASPPLLERCAGVWMPGAPASAREVVARRPKERRAPATNVCTRTPHHVRPPQRSFLRAATSHTYARGLPILSTRFPISTTRTRLALRTRSTAHELPGQRFEQSQAKAAREQQELVLSKVTQRSAARGEHPRPTLFSVSSCGLSVTRGGPAARASAHARTHARTLAAACPPRVRLRPPCAAPSLAASRSRAAVPRPPEGAMGVCVSAPRRGCAAGLEGAAALCPDATSGSSDQLAPEWVLTS